jgi:glutamine amidotransferase
MITIIDYGAGNIRSVANMLNVIGAKSRISDDPADVLAADRLILPGVGHFDYGMKALRASGLEGALNRRVVAEGAPLLGICLGAQLLTRGSEEGDEPGLGWIPADTVSFDRARFRARLSVPHMGWSDTRSALDHPLTDGAPPDQRFYYVHSFHIVCDDPADRLFRTTYGYEFDAGVQRANIAGVQFHPEKSHRFGMDILSRFATWLPRTNAKPLSRS